MRGFVTTLLPAILLASPVMFAPRAARAGEEAGAAAFPKSRPPGGSFPRPREGEVLDVSPPGFCWWRAAAKGELQYRLKVTAPSGAVAYQSPRLEDPVCVPDEVFPAGRYSWTVEALDAKDAVRDTWPQRSFVIAENAYAQPWIPPAELLARVPAEHPRLLFPKAMLGEVRATLTASRREAFESLRGQADRALQLKVPAEPDYDKISDGAERRLAYVRTFREMRRYHTGGMLDAALMYALTEEKKYGEAAKALLCGAAEWDPEGISSVMAPYGDEVGLGLAKSAALAYDWIYDLLSESEKAKVKKMLIARADQMLRRLQRRDFLNRPESSHDGRLPGYLLEHAIALAEEPRAGVWMDYGLRAIMTVFPHWAGEDGGWAEGLAYGTAYNTIFITPLVSLERATGEVEVLSAQ